MIDFRNQVVIVTGAGRGLGRLYALEFGRLGASVVVNDLGGATEGGGRDTSVADAVVDEIKSAGGAAVASYDSVATPEGGEAIVRTATDTFGRLDAVVSNAGILSRANFEDMTVEEWRALQSVHVDGTFYLVQPAYRVMKAQGYGRLVLTSSSSGMFGCATQVHYGAAKGAVVGFNNIVAIEGAPYGIKSNVILPGGVTRMLSVASGGNAAVLEGPLAKLMDPDLVVPMVVYLASRDCAVTRQNFSATMGRYARVFAGVGEGWLAEPGTRPGVDDIAANLDAITSTEPFYVPFSVADETTEVFRRRGLEFVIPQQQD